MLKPFTNFGINTHFKKQITQKIGLNSRKAYNLLTGTAIKQLQKELNLREIDLNLKEQLKRFKKFKSQINLAVIKK